MPYIELLIDGLNYTIDTNDLAGLQPDGPSHTILHFKNGDRLQCVHPFKELNEKVIQLSNGESNGN